VKMSLMRVVGLCQIKMNYHNLRQKSINLIECRYKLKPSDDEDNLCEPDWDDEEDLYNEDNDVDNDNDKGQTFLIMKILLTLKVIS
jgi:hypothetical protein